MITWGTILKGHSVGKVETHGSGTWWDVSIRAGAITWLSAIRNGETYSSQGVKHPLTGRVGIIVMVNWIPLTQSPIRVLSYMYPGHKNRTQHCLKRSTRHRRQAVTQWEPAGMQGHTWDRPLLPCQLVTKPGLGPRVINSPGPSALRQWFQLIWQKDNWATKIPTKYDCELRVI